MNNWLKSILVGLAMGGLAFLVSIKTFPSSKSQSCTVHYVLGSTKKLDTKRDLLGEAPALIKDRITELGYRSIVGNLGNNRLDIRVENVTDTTSLRRVIVNNVVSRKIEFRELYTLDELPGLFQAADKASDKIFAAARRKDVGIYSIVSPLVAEEIEGKNVLPAAIASVNKHDTAILNKILREPYVLAAIPVDVEFYYGYLTDENQAHNLPDELHLYAIRTKGEQAKLQNRDIARAEGGIMQIRIRFNNNGQLKFAELTGDNVRRYLAVVLDDMVVMTPKVYHAITTGSMILTVRTDHEDARLLADQLTTSYLPDGFAIIKEEISLKSKRHTGKLIATLLATFIVSAGLALVFFNSLKNSQRRP